MRKKIHCIVSVMIVLICLSGGRGWANHGSADEGSNILVLHAFAYGSITNRVNDGFYQEVKKNRPDDNIFVEYLDASRNPEVGKRNNFIRYLQGKYADRRIDLIVVVDPLLEPMATDMRASLFPAAKIIAARSPNALVQVQQFENISYISMKMGVSETFNQMFLFQPGLRNVLVITDQSVNGRTLANYAKKAWEPFGDKAKLSLLASDDIDGVIQQIEQLDQRDAILFMSFIKDSQNRLYNSNTWHALLGKHNKAPVYGIIAGDYYGLPANGERASYIGGYLWDIGNVGVELGKLSVRILNGDIPPEAVEATEVVKPIFDYRGLERFGFSLSLVPPGSVITDRPFSFIETYWHLVIGTVILFLLLVIALLVFFCIIKKQKRAEENLLDVNGQLTELYEEMAATEEELRGQYAIKDKSEQQLERLYERYQLALEGSNDVIWDVDCQAQRVFTSRRIEIVFGIPYEEEGYDYETWIKMIYVEDWAVFTKDFQEHLLGITSCWDAEYRFVGSEKDVRWVGVRGKTILDKDGHAVRMAGSIADITEQKMVRQQVEHMAYYDSLTNLPNRVLFHSRLAEYLARGQVEEQPLAFILIDLDNFKVVNDVYGHHTGDLLLKEIADSLAMFITDKSFVCRFGGDEFIFFLYGYSDLQEIEKFIAGIRSCVERAITIKYQVFQPAVSIGISLYPNDGKGFDELLQCADLALYQVKGGKKASYQFFNGDMHAIVSRKMEMEAGIKAGLKTGEFKLFYQPKVNLGSGEVEGAEALIRWVHPDKGIVPPLEFIAIAEESGLIIPLGSWVIAEACRFAKRILEHRGKPLCIAVNISPLQLEEPGFVDLIKKILADNKISTLQLEVEITESILLKNFEEISEKINALREIGIVVAMDDFGTGYSSLTYLQRLPIDILKIDRGFVNNINVDEKSNTLIGSIIDLSHAFGFKVVAEGIEEEEQLALLKTMNCDIGQGYYISRPLPEDEFVKWLGVRT